MSEAGYVHIHRSLIGHPDFRNDAESMAFAWMVIRAAWRPVRVRYKGVSVSIGRGQLCVSQRDMAAALDRDKAWVERLLKRLLVQGMIEASREAAAMLITICNYDEYQPDGAKREAAIEAPPEAVNEAGVRQGRGTEQRREEVKKEEGSEAKASSPREVFPRPDFADPQHWRDFLENRKRKRLPNTSTAHKKLLADIDRIATDEWPPGRLIEHAAAKGWGGIYDPNGDTRNGTTQSLARPGAGLRGSRPSPALDLLRSADAEIEAERSACGQTADWRAWDQIPSIGSGRP